ncbi:MAG: MFS transporter, partial [Pseudomonadota bacterium]
MDKKASNQFELLTQRRFLPYFLVQFLGAFNDNIFRYALIILISFMSAAQLSASESSTLINLSAALFILPFFLFSSTAGQFADKYEKSFLIRRIKLMEIFIMCCAAIGFYLHSIPILMVVLFLMGTQSAFFGPIKYSILPQHLREEELVGGNGMVEMATFLAILLGTMLGSNLIQVENIGVVLVIVAIIGFASLGYLVSHSIPETPATDAGLKINWNIFSETWANIKFARENRTVFLSIMGNSWFWFLGSAYLAQLPNYTR